VELSLGPPGLGLPPESGPDCAYAMLITYCDDMKLEFDKMVTVAVRIKIEANNIVDRFLDCIKVKCSLIT
jgi:hypothetical protein